MKLLLIITDYGSFNNFLSELALTVSGSEDHEIVIICSQAKVINIDDKEAFNKLKFHFVDIPRKMSPFGEWKAAREIRRIVIAEKPDLVHSHFTTATFPVLLLKNTKTPYWATFHGLGMNASSGLKKVVFTFAEMMCFTRLQKIYTVNQADSDLVRKYFKSKLKKYDCLGFGCDTTKFNIQHVSEQVIKRHREDLSINSAHFTIAFTGRFVNFKGFHLVIKAFRIITELFPDSFKLILMGGTDPIHSTGLNDQELVFLNNSADILNIGFTSRVEEYLAITDIFLFPSKKEGLPTCSLEALSMGVPVVTFDTRGNSDLIKHNFNGLLLDPNQGEAAEIEDIVKSLIWIRDNTSQRSLFRDNALKGRDAYSRLRFVNEQMNYYNDFKKNGTI